MSQKVIDLMVEEIKTELGNGLELEEIKDNSSEWVDGHLPVYNNEIIKEWQDMPGEYDDRGAEELGGGAGKGIVALMSLDLFLYYTDLFKQAVDDVELELEEAGA
jgi:hypothetical protein